MVWEILPCVNPLCPPSPFRTSDRKILEKIGGHSEENSGKIRDEHSKKSGNFRFTTFLTQSTLSCQGTRACRRKPRVHEGRECRKRVEYFLRAPSPPPDPAHTVGLNSRIPPTPPHDPSPPFPHPYPQAIARPTPGKNYPLRSA